MQTEISISEMRKVSLGDVGGHVQDCPAITQWNQGVPGSPDSQPPAAFPTQTGSEVVLMQDRLQARGRKCEL